MLILCVKPTQNTAKLNINGTWKLEGVQSVNISEQYSNQPHVQSLMTCSNAQL